MTSVLPGVEIKGVGRLGLVVLALRQGFVLFKDLLVAFHFELRLDTAGNGEEVVHVTTHGAAAAGVDVQSVVRHLKLGTLGELI